MAACCRRAGHCMRPRRNRQAVLLYRRYRRVRARYRVRQAGAGGHHRRPALQTPLPECAHLRQSSLRLHPGGDRIPDRRKDAGRGRQHDPLAHSRSREILPDRLRPRRSGIEAGRHPVRGTGRGNRAQSPGRVLFDGTGVVQFRSDPRRSEPQVPRYCSARLWHRGERRAAEKFRFPQAEPAPAVFPHEIGTWAPEHEIPLRGRRGGTQGARGGGPGEEPHSLRSA